MKNLPIQSRPEVYRYEDRCVYITTQNVKFEHKFDTKNRSREFEVFVHSVYTSLLLSGELKEASKVFPTVFSRNFFSN
jgi:hypothetical protein